MEMWRITLEVPEVFNSKDIVSPAVLSVNPGFSLTDYAVPADNMNQG